MGTNLKQGKLQTFSAGDLSRAVDSINRLPNSLKEAAQLVECLPIMQKSLGFNPQHFMKPTMLA